MSRQTDDYTKPSRLKRRRKKRWKIADLIEAGLTDCLRVAMLFTAGTSSTGRENLVGRQGEKSPQLLAAFLCPSFSAASCRVHSVMAGCFGHGSSMAAPCRSFSPHYSPSPNAVRSISGGLFL
ncbi:hypothetical protein [Methylomonas rhizoryzae]|uniref:hypothetical protein n=1 Tax=Methylomonas rhizoryzae TaxID=2608981 RepID=UPI001232869E|nr:hypothetical protein [Methylomonas rhizoryzae]